jgi:radial spoke head protein 3
VRPRPLRVSVESLLTGYSLQSAQAEAERLEREAADRRRRRTMERKRHMEEEARPRTPEAVSGRVHAEIQTEEYLEELADRPVEVEVGVQTDPYADRPPTPPYVPPKSGVDEWTQVEPGVLFDFDLEVQPLLEVLVGKSLEQGLMEVLEEEELAAIRAHQQEFETLRAAELTRVQRLEDEQRRLEEEKERRLTQERDRARRERLAREKIAAVAFARRYVQSVRASVLGRLVDEGHFYDPMAKEVEQEVLPGVLKGAVASVARAEDARKHVDAILHQALALAKERHEQEVARQQAEAEARRAAEEEARKRAEEEATRKKAEEEARKAAEAAAGGDADGADEDA